MMALYTHLAAVALGAAVAFGGAWKVQENRYEHQISGMKVATAKKDADQQAQILQREQVARLAEQALSAKYQGALDEATKRETRLRTELDGVRRTAGGLRDTLYAIRRDAPNYSQPAAAATTGTLAELFEQCSAALVDLGEKADRHASDSLMLLEAWPRTTPQK